MINKKNCAINALISASAIALCPAVAHAQTAAGQATSEADNYDIIVTAQKRSESLQRVPVAVTAVNAADLRESGVDTVYELPRLAPSLYVDTGIAAAKIRMAIRGIGSAGGTAVEPSVATFLDGIYIPREGAANGAYLDLQAVEVLRGPQGTLFGRNASVGAISLTSAQPSQVSSASATAEYGTGPRYKASGHLNVPLGDTTAIRIAGMAEVADSLYSNIQPGQDAGDMASYAGRVSLRQDFGPDFQVTARVAAAGRNGRGYIAQFALLPDTFPEGSLQGFLDANAAIGTHDFDLHPFDRTKSQYTNDRLNDRNWSASLEADWSMPGDFTVKFLNGYAHWKSDFRLTGAFPATLPTIDQFTNWDSESHSHELQLISPEDRLLGGALSFLGGVYYMEEKLAIQESLHLYPAFCQFLGAKLSPVVGGLCNAQAAVPGARAYNQGFTQKTESLAIYGQATYAITPQLDLTLGARYTRDTKTPAVSQVVNYPIGTLFAANEDFSGRIKDSQPTYRANLTFRPSDNAMVYATFSTGFKSAGFNSTTSTTPLEQLRYYDAETVESYEVGVRSTWFDNGLTLNATAYRMYVDGFQDRSHNGLNFSVKNAGDIRNQGFEVEATIRPMRGLAANVSIAYLDSVFTDYPAGSQLPGVVGPPRDLTGERPTFTPKWQGTAGVQYNAEIGSDLQITARSDVAFISSNNISPVNDANPAAYQDRYALLSARLTLAALDDNWAVSAFGENLTGTNYCTAYSYPLLGAQLGIVRPGDSAFGCNTVGQPRTYGASVSKRF